MDWMELFPSRFVKAADFKGRDVTLKITAFITEELPQENGAMKRKGILCFDGTPKQLVINRTNAACIAAMFGPETDGWIGKRITFFPAPYIDHTGLGVDIAIRVRGSPDIERDIHFDLRLPRKKPVKAHMRRTGKAAAVPPKKSEPVPPPAAAQEQEGLPSDDEDPLHPSEVPTT